MSEYMEENVIDEYINQCSKEIQPKLKELRKIILEVSKDLTEKFSWQMPTFYYKKNIIHFAANKNHIGIYPGPEAIEAFSDRLLEYKTSKGAIQIPNNRELDSKLIQDIVRFNLEKQ